MGQPNKLLDHIMANVAKLAKDKHGNYVVQCILEKGRCEDKQRTIRVVRENLVDYAKDKVSSNVVEKCFEVATIGPDAELLTEDRNALYRTVLGDPADMANAPLQQLMHDRFGNYTVQCIIKHSRGDDREELRRRIMALEPELKNFQTGKHIVAALHREA